MAKRVIATAATVTPITLAELRTHLREPDHAEDAFLNTLISAAVEWCEGYTWSKLCSQTWDEYFDGFASPLPLWYSPVSAITSVTYTDTDGDAQTLAATVYELGNDNGKGTCRLKYDQTWPSTRGHADVVTVKYVTGYGAASAVPTPIKHAIKLLCGHLFENREQTIESIGLGIKGIPFGIFSLLAPYCFWEAQ
jgi:uncharacterized phiE125 gp8 family phage protein